MGKVFTVVADPFVGGGGIGEPGAMPALKVEVEPNCAILPPPPHDAISTDAMTSAASFRAQTGDTSFTFKLIIFLVCLCSSNSTAVQNLKVVILSTPTWTLNKRIV